MRYEAIDAKLFIDHRARLAAQLKPNSLVVINSNDVLPTNADGTLPFKQNSDLFYLSGVDQEQTILVIFPDAQNEKLREVLFIRETNEHIAVWEGQKLCKEQAREMTGIQTVHWTKDFDHVFRGLMVEAERVYLNENDHLRASTSVESCDARFIRQCRERFPLHRFERVAPLLHRMRQHKHPVEVATLQKACDITEAGYRRALGFIQPGVHEFEIEAEYLHEFLRRRSRGFAYSPIVGSGGNACVLHYLDNNAVCQDGDMVLMDIGAEYANYNADMTRTVPVNGHFTDRQRAVYSAVLRIFRESSALLRPGVIHKEHLEEVQKMMDSALIDLGLLSREDIDQQDKHKPARQKYFMHGVAHHLGLDVHDVGSYHPPVEAGQVYTMEPGIYIREESLGIRLENDLLVGADGNVDLMASIPIEIDEIEELMQAGRD